MRSKPPPALIASLPSPPLMLSSPNRSVRTSSPAPPLTASLPAPPSRRSLPPSPQSVSSPSLEWMRSAASRAAEHDVLLAVEAEGAVGVVDEQVVLVPLGGRVVDDVAGLVDLESLELEREVRPREDVERQMRRVGRAHHELGEGVLFELGQEVQPVSAREVVEAVAVLQLLQLRLEDEVEGRAEQAAERHLLLGEAADPEVDVVEAARARRPAVEERRPGPPARPCRR